MRRLVALALATALSVPLAACSDEPVHDPAGGPTETTPPASPVPSSADPSATPSGDPSASGSADPQALPPVRHRVSLPALMREDVRAGRLRRTEPLASTARWRSWTATYTVDGATVSGELLVPRGRGPFPAVVLNHGYIDPAIYTLGRGLSREQEWLAAAGFVVLHTDYRGHAGSDPVGDVDRESRLAYTRDAIGAVKALEQEPYVDDDRLAMLGRSMGGGVTLNALVAEPGLVDAAVVFASVSSRFVDNIRQFTEPNRPEELARYYDRFGTPEESPRFYRDLSSRTFFDRVTEPVLMLHGSADDTCPVAWSRQTHGLLREAGADAELEVYAGEGHAFGPRFADSMRRTLEFLRVHLRL
ncbi:alpha/beta fold hydrolase [Nocardioides sp. zg-579]|uniref:Alpha/beta fold hydrolase n=1 Tax=Nocardioides marmotae TaxID=2663857 RepID=A0A6I3JCN8_9ACTN|nr:alpha/beta fold hydrolase [Nocardioides marmotae]MCR6032298.1 alpha/beta fold hydrolase [Gordonia jinghuaiqii]MTB95946.1 alpha/beta fold hydrolase [Nocardioides marmotae]QKE02718.1 alpha/beta fold hydrolase [Nocardioides marmotae]